MKVGVTYEGRNDQMARQNPTCQTLVGAVGKRRTITWYRFSGSWGGAYDKKVSKESPIEPSYI